MSVDWEICERCAEEGGIGVCLPSGEKCWMHADDQDLDAALKQLGQGGQLDARGVPITDELLNEMLASAPHDEHGRPVLTNARFDGATFLDEATFTRAVFKGDSSFERAIFKDRPWFDLAIFQGWASFHEATFRNGVLFTEVVFDRQATFNGAIFRGEARFYEAAFNNTTWFQATAFEGIAVFNGATFRGEARFNYPTTFREAMFGRATFEDSAWFQETSFGPLADFQRATFKGQAVFDQATFERHAGFRGAEFEHARQLGPMLVRKSLVLDQAVFHERAQIDVSAAAVCCRRTRFLAGVQLRARWASVTLDDADLAAPAILAGAPAFKRPPSGEDLDESALLASWPDGPGGPPRPPGQPWVASLCRADVAGLAIANTDLQACRFAGAHNLDRLGLEGPQSLLPATPGLKAVATGWAWPPVWWWTRRQTLAEEHAWRAAHERGIRQAGWHASETWPTSSSHWVPNSSPAGRDLGRLERHLAQAMSDWRHPRRLRRRLALAWHIGTARTTQELARRRQAIRVRQEQAREVANLYRALRKAREDAKDEPGAADFYYGEMEMRRHATPRFSAERAILTLYWLVAGYALRAWRAFATLTVVLMLAAWLLVHRHGFAVPQAMTFWGALRYSGRTAIGLLPKDQPTLTPWGDILQITVRVAVPVLLGLAALSIRGRVKR